MTGRRAACESAWAISSFAERLSVAHSQRILRRGSAPCGSMRSSVRQATEEGQMKKRLQYVIAAACLLAGGALGGNLLAAGAATNSSAPQGVHGSNETATHEKGESAAREEAEDSGQLGRDRAGDGDAD